MRMTATIDETTSDEPRIDDTKTAVELLECSRTVRTLHPAQDVADGTLWYGVPADGALVSITSKREAHRADQLPAGLALRHTDPGPSTITRELALRWVSDGASGSVAGTLDALADYFGRYVVLRDRRTALWVSAWALGTWCHRGFRVFPYLSIRSAEKRCGKSRVLGLLARVGFNASPVTAHPTEAQLYRGAARSAGVQLFDEAEMLRGDGKRFDALITVLNVGFERGGVVLRLEHRGERYVEVPYEVFAPRVLAGIEGLKETLEDRALPLFMLRKRRAEAVARLGRATEADAQALRDQCALACLTHIGPILAAYDGAPALLEGKGIDDRAVDLWSPLVALTIVADGEDRGGRTQEMLGAAAEVGALREADGDSGGTAQLLDALDAIRKKSGPTVTASQLLDALHQRPGWETVTGPRRLAALLNPLGIARQQVRSGDRRRWCYFLDAAQLADLRARYGGTESSDTTLGPAAGAGVHDHKPPSATSSVPGQRPRSC
jgi:hypothetical protein